MDVARAHYEACDALGLSPNEVYEIGRAATQRANATTLNLLVRLARGAGATPWTGLVQVNRLWARTCDGGALAVARLGPKEARMDAVGYPLAGITYNRVSFRGIIAAVVELFSQRAYVKEIPGLCSSNTLGMRISWA